MCLLAGSTIASGISVTGSDWRIHFSLPDQSGSVVSPGEFAIREALLARIYALQSGQTGTLSTYTFSGNTASSGAAGPIITAITRALDTGATVRFIVDNAVNISSNFNGTNSLSSLAARPTNPLILSQETNTSVIMHNKFALFDLGPGNRWVFTGSWNYTGGASTFQWNIALEARNDALYAAYAAEASEMLAGRFHGDAAKSHAHDKVSFALEGSWSNGTARFSPPTNAAAGGDNPLTDIQAAISNASVEILFALNQVTLQTIANALTEAANRGISIHGVIPRSDADPGESSAAIYDFLNSPTNYTTTNRVHFLTPYSRADGSTLDAGEDDLVHAKYMVIDPWEARPLAILGSPNWTQQALVNTAGNDENLLIIRHRDIARMLYAHIQRMTGALTQRDDFWCSIAATSMSARLTVWMTDTNQYLIENASPVAPAPAWSTWQPTFTGRIGQLVFTNPPAASYEWYRVRRVP